MEREMKITYGIVLFKLVCILIMFAIVMHQDYQIKVLEACMTQPNLPECAELKKEK